MLNFVNSISQMGKGRKRREKKRKGDKKQKKSVSTTINNTTFSYTWCERSACTLRKVHQQERGHGHRPNHRQPYKKARECGTSLRKRPTLDKVLCFTNSGGWAATAIIIRSCGVQTANRCNTRKSFKTLLCKSYRFGIKSSTLKPYRFGHQRLPQIRHTKTLEALHV